jgi:putative redox protein
MKYKLEKPVQGKYRNAKYQCVIEWRNGKFITDEPPSIGGNDSGPDPYTLLLSSLASCKLVTLRMYIDRKQWPIDNIAVSVNCYQESKEEVTTTIIDCDIVFLDTVSDEQKMKLLEIAKNCPVSKILQGDVKVRVFAFRDGDAKTIKYANEEITVLWKPEFASILPGAGPSYHKCLNRLCGNGLIPMARLLKGSGSRWPGVHPVHSCF